jgi:hypothetical protein
MEFIKRFEDRAPVYAKVYREPIVNRFANVGGGKETEMFERGKFFSNVYELYMYAAMLGLKKELPPAFGGVETQKFIEIRDWKTSTELVRFIEMALIARSDLDLNELENMEEAQVEGTLTELKKLLEEYANGGFDLIYTKVQDEPYFFENEYCFVEMLGEGI